MKLLSSINTICDYILAPLNDIDYFIKKFSMKPASKKKINFSEMRPQDIIKDIINIFKSFFPKKSKTDIEETLYQNSFDIENAYCVLRNKKNLDFLSFNEKDYCLLEKIIEKKETYTNEEHKEMINIKGEDLIQRRKIFLFDGNLPEKKIIMMQRKKKRKKQIKKKMKKKRLIKSEKNNIEIKDNIE